MMCEMINEIIEKYGGKIPEDKKDLMALPGISDYIASAVRCFAFNVPESLLDTNTVRIIGRVFGKKITDASRRSSTMESLYKALMPSNASREFAFALIDLGALVCLSRNPRCKICPVNRYCLHGLS